MEGIHGQQGIKRALKCGTVLAQRYEIDGVLGEGGFGITYQGRTKDQDKKVAIKEYFPADLASREDADLNQNLHIFRGEKEEEFEKGRTRFLKEAEILREFQYLEGIVSVMDYFECNETAYIVMEYVEGITLKQYVRDNGCLTYPELMQLLTPVMRSLIQIHRQGLIHRDISPDNLLIGLDNKARLIDFGAANRLGDKSSQLRTVILKSGYAPPEQYLEEGKQGPWTDVYGLSAMMYMALTGVTPVDSVARLQGTDLPVLDAATCEMENWQTQALYTGMELKVSKRYKNVEELYNGLTVQMSKEDVVTMDKSKESKNKRNYQRDHRNMLWIIVVTLFLVGSSLYLWISSQKEDSAPNDISSLEDTDTAQEVESQIEKDNEPQICIMPDVEGLTEALAKTRIKAVDSLIRIVVMYEESSEEQKGKVTNQSVAANTRYNEGGITEIILTVGNGEAASSTEEDARPQREPGTTEHTTEATTEDTTQEKTTEDTTEDYNITEEEEYEDFPLG